MFRLSKFPQHLNVFGIDHESTDSPNIGNNKSAKPEFAPLDPMLWLETPIAWELTSFYYLQLNHQFTTEDA